MNVGQIIVVSIMASIPWAWHMWELGMDCGPVTIEKTVITKAEFIPIRDMTPEQRMDYLRKAYNLEAVWKK